MKNEKSRRQVGLRNDILKLSSPAVSDEQLAFAINRRITEPKNADCIKSAKVRAVYKKWKLKSLKLL